MVTNGGFNGVNAALANGVPLVVAPGSEEKDEVAARVKWTGTGIVLQRRILSKRRIRGAISKILADPRYRQRAAHLQQEHQCYKGPGRATELIEELISSRGSTGVVPHRWRYAVKAEKLLEAPQVYRLSRRRRLHAKPRSRRTGRACCPRSLPRGTSLGCL
jgi:UDP-glucoronosyl and UDP-glucosyl transferase